jgi:TRAP-type mannitol/chloroaromatic compound transport system substrate-binding protein
MKETRILLNETSFTNLCKMGYFTHSGQLGTTNITITKNDIKKLASGEIVIKDFSDEVIKIALQDIGSYLIKEIIKRSPIFSEMYYEM